MTTITLKAQELKRYSLFKKQDEMDRDIWRYVDWLQEHHVRQSVIDVLRNLGSRALMYLGIAFPKQQTIAKDLKLSDKTVNLAIKDLEALGIIESRRTLNGWRASGKVYQIKPFCLERLSQKVKSVTCVKPSHTNDFTLVSDFEPYPTKQKFLKKDVAPTGETSHSQNTVKTFYQKLKALVQARKGAIQGFSQLMKVIFGKMKKMRSEGTLGMSNSQLEQIMYQSLDVLLHKQGVKNEQAMLNAIINNKISDMTTPQATPSAAPAAKRTEVLPDWFATRHERVETVLSAEEEAELAEARARVLKKLGLA
ncbi:helix-turn-helix domain-containing protein [Caryophanon tenue]|uniref:Helix-turn-helix domain-containing protein n=1 Tax=Caryophanon tenue TaxID=33978 RepID=A0A1C0Y8J3_9BACL|nr:helix-turn-helix domain-containing protein [Caryophanon tenue]OCS83471.1 hypothetical protein A6M13_15840 [Caryophanon tenue]